MEYVHLGNSGLVVSKLCLGTMNMGSKQWKPWIFDEKESEPIIVHALDKGVNFIDLADFYSSGVNEEICGNILRRIVKRDEIVITSKVGYPIGGGKNNQGHSRVHLEKALDGTLKRLKLDYLDVYMLHYFDVTTPEEETWDAMNSFVKSGKVRYLACSTMMSWQFAKIYYTAEKNGWQKPINMQLQLSAAYREEEREMIPLCHELSVGVSVFSPLARGILSCDFSSNRNTTDFFTHEMFGDPVSKEIAMSVSRVAQRHGVPPAQIAQAWVLQHPGVNVMLVGADSREQFDTALRALEMPAFSSDDRYEIERNYTPRDHINDYNADCRIPRLARPAKPPYV
jgi:aryl-alcohol dehydrogenase-like predicted oxidoreductase